MLENDRVSLIALRSTTPQIQELILKEPLRDITSPTEIKEGHSLRDYYCANLTELTNIGQFEKRQIMENNLLFPQQLALASIILKEEPGEKWKCTLIMNGLYLQNSHLLSNAVIPVFQREKKVYMGI